LKRPEGFFSRSLRFDYSRIGFTFCYKSHKIRVATTGARCITRDIVDRRRARYIHEAVRDSSRRFERELEPFIARPSKSESVLNRAGKPSVPFVIYWRR